MTKKEFYELTGENPEDMFGGDWKNEIEELEIELKQIDLEEKIANEIEARENEQIAEIRREESVGEWAELHCCPNQDGEWEC